MKAKIQQLQEHTNEALDFPIVSIAFLPDSAWDKPKAVL